MAEFGADAVGFGEVLRLARGVARGDQGVDVGALSASVRL